MNVNHVYCIINTPLYSLLIMQNLVSNYVLINITFLRMLWKHSIYKNLTHRLIILVVKNG